MTKKMKRAEFIRNFMIGGVAAAAGVVRADDPNANPFSGSSAVIPHTFEDGESAALRDGKVVLPARQVPVFHETDVLVVGGGCAGFAAAVAAAKTGAKVALVEKDGSLGGLFTNGMVLIMLSSSRREEGGKCTLVTRGVCGEFMDRAEALGANFCTKRSARNCNQPTVDPEGAKYLMDRMVEERKIDMFFHAWGMDVIQEGNRVQGVVFMSKQGLQAILAREVVDATGDGDVFFAAGGDCCQLNHPIGFVARLANIDRVTAKNVPRGEDGKPLPGHWPLRSNEGNPSSYWMNTQSRRADGLSVRDLTREEIHHRKTVWEEVARMRRTPGWEKVYISNTCSQIGPRVTRLVKSGCVVDRAKLAANWNPPDAIGWCGDGEVRAFPVPYRSLLPEGVENVIAAGRMVGAPDTCDTFRLICPCFVTGEAAGTAAALAAKRGCTPRELPYGELRRQLVANGVYI